MRGLMMDTPLLISSILEHARGVFADQQIVTRTVEGPIHRYTYAEAHARACQLANALAGLGVGQGDRIATIAWNTHRHFEIYFAVSGMGSICHTMNPRLHPSQVAYIVNHAEDRVLFVDLTFLPFVEAVADKLPSVRQIVVMTDRAHMPETKLADILCYEDLVNGHSDIYDWPTFDENTASSLCYTSGTTGHPKGVLYSHRSTVLHSYAVCLPDVMHLAESEAFLPVVPMFHVNAWGTPYAAPLSGVKLVMPGPGLDGASLTELMNAEEVTTTAGVPTVWLGLLNHWRQQKTSVPTLKRLVVGGSAVPRSMIEIFHDDFGIEVRHAWGMTEMSPLGSVNVLKSSLRDAPAERRFDVLSKQGRPIFGVRMKIVDEQDKPLPHDGKAFGTLKVQGPWVCSSYYKLDESEAHDAEGWFATGDVATLDADSYMAITDREKDLIKSGGEWISSIDIENLAMSHVQIAQAAVVGIADVKWGERPLLIVVPAPGTAPAKTELLKFFEGKIAKWMIPDDVVFVDSLPIGATGKVLKGKLREEYADYQPTGR
ncbi:MAG: long-chain-fatty-acid--CoA ligase [Inquilinus sp.]|nr:long-chain-fatty-acid--CoA ligase [Inquilinus sp.]